MKRNDQEDDIEYRPAKVNYQRKGSKSEALENLFNIAGMSDSSSDSSEFSCPSADGYFPSWECRQYYHCSHGLSTKKTCSPGLGWNINTNTCDWIHNLSHCR